jgi:hypothetical protein
MALAVGMIVLIGNRFAKQAFYEPIVGHKAFISRIDSDSDRMVRAKSLDIGMELWVHIEDCLPFKGMMNADYESALRGMDTE